MGQMVRFDEILCWAAPSHDSFAGDQAGSGWACQGSGAGSETAAMVQRGPGMPGLAPGPLRAAQILLGCRRALRGNIGGGLRRFGGALGEQSGEKHDDYPHPHAAQRPVHPVALGAVAGRLRKVHQEQRCGGDDPAVDRVVQEAERRCVHEQDERDHFESERDPDPGKSQTGSGVSVRR